MGMDFDGSDGKGSANGGESSALVQTLSSVLNQANMTSAEEKPDSISIEGNLKNGNILFATCPTSVEMI